jgi:hypothetical protein
MLVYVSLGGQHLGAYQYASLLLDIIANPLSSTLSLVGRQFGNWQPRVADAKLP